MIVRKWDVQFCINSWPLQLGIHIDHTDPSLTVHLPSVLIAIGKLKQPGLATSGRCGWGLVGGKYER